MNVEPASNRSGTNIVAFDYGTQRIGIAVGNPNIGTGQGIGVARVKDGRADFETIRKKIDEWQPAGLVVGMPGGKPAQSTSLKKQINRFAGQLQECFKLPVDIVDETLSSEESNHRMKNGERRIKNSKKTLVRNEISAAIILETYFNTVQHHKTK